MILIKRRCSKVSHILIDLVRNKESFCDKKQMWKRRKNKRKDKNIEKREEGKLWNNLQKWGKRNQNDYGIKTVRWGSSASLEPVASYLVNGQNCHDKPASSSWWLKSWVMTDRSYSCSSILARQLTANRLPDDLPVEAIACLAQPKHEQNVTQTQFSQILKQHNNNERLYNSQD